MPNKNKLNTKSYQIDRRQKNGLIKQKLFEYKRFLGDFSIIFNARTDGDLLSVRDDILGDINQLLYLLSFNN